jgi:hypothetical protein
MSRSKRSSKLLEDTTLVSRVLRTGFVEVTPAVSTIWCLGFSFDLDLALYVVGWYVSYVPQAKRHAG